MQWLESFSSFTLETRRPLPIFYHVERENGFHEKTGSKKDLDKPETLTTF